jgi:two-component system, response regulator
MNGSPVEIVLIEDNEEDAELALRALRKSRIANQIVVLRDGAEAVEFLFADGPEIQMPRPKLILLDLKIPKIDGLEVLRRIKADERLRQIPVVMLTSSRQESDLLASYRLGVNSYIVKPVDFDSFIKAVSDVGLYWMLLNQVPH